MWSLCQRPPLSFLVGYDMLQPFCCPHFTRMLNTLESWRALQAKHDSALWSSQPARLYHGCNQCIAAGPPAAPGLPPPLPGAPPAGQLAVGGALSGAVPPATAPAPANPVEPSPYVQVEGMVSAQVLADDEEYKDVS